MTPIVLEEHLTPADFEDVSAFSRDLKRLSRELQSPVIALAQLSRFVEQRTDMRPLLSPARLRADRGRCRRRRDAYRDDYYHADSESRGETELLIRKSRQATPAPTASYGWTFDAEHQRFTSSNDRAQHSRDTAF